MRLSQLNNAVAWAQGHATIHNEIWQVCFVPMSMASDKPRYDRTLHTRSAENPKQARSFNSSRVIGPVVLGADRGHLGRSRCLGVRLQGHMLCHHLCAKV